MFRIIGDEIEKAVCTLCLLMKLVKIPKTGDSFKKRSIPKAGEYLELLNPQGI